MNNPYQAPKANLETVQPQEGTHPRFTFDVDGNEIVGEFSLATGRERIYLNGELLFSKINFRRRGEHTLHINGEDYQVVIMADSLVKPIRTCTLEKDGMVLKKYRSVSKPKQVYFYIALLIIIIETVFSDFVAYKFDLPHWSPTVSMLFFFVVFITGMYLSHKNGSYQVFEEKPDATK